LALDIVLQYSLYEHLIAVVSLNAKIAPYSV